jgi:CheY-like chemotaxis protein
VGYRVLVVDDNTDAATSLAMVLRMNGMHVDIAHDGSQALAQAQAFQPQAVLLDIGMPGLDGYEVARRLRDDPATRHITLIAITGWSRLQDKQRGRAAGFDHHFRKPVDLPRLCALLGDLRTQALAAARSAAVSTPASGTAARDARAGMA